jgi:translation initiation factor IF-1
MQIFVRTLTGDSITLDVQNSDKIGDVKQKLYNARQAPPPDQQSLVLGGKYLSEDHNLGDYNVTQGSTIHVTGRTRGGAKIETKPSKAKSGPIKTKQKASDALVLAQPGETFYGRVVRALGDRRFTVENTSTGMMVPCRLGGSVGYKDRSQANIKAADWVLVSMRMYESENQYNDRKGEILLRYSDGQVRQLTKAGELRERASDQQSSVVFVTQEDYAAEKQSVAALRQSSHFDVPSDSSESDEEEEEQETVRTLALARVAHQYGDALPSPTACKSKSRKPSAQASDSLIQLDFHHSLSDSVRLSRGFSIEGAVAAEAAPSQTPNPPRFYRPAPAPAPAPVATWIRARVRFWDAAKGIGYAIPEDKSQTKGGVDVKLTVECVQALKKPLLPDDVVEVSIDPRHDRPYVLGAGLRRAARSR